MYSDGYVLYTTKEYIELENNIVNTVKRFIKNNKKVYIYGAGDFGKRIWNFLHLNGRLETYIAGYIVSNKNNNNNPDKVYGIKVFPYKEINLTDAGVILALDVKHHKSVKIDLEEVGVKEILSFNAIEYYQMYWRNHHLTSEYINRYHLLFAEKIVHPINLNSCCNILLICTDSIGDEVINIPFVRELRNNLSHGAKITMVVQPAVAQIMKHCPYIDKLLVYSGKDYEGYNVEESIRKSKLYADLYLRSEKYDIVFLHGWYSVHLEFLFLAVFSLAKVRIGFSEKNMFQKQYYNMGFDRFLSLPIVSTNVMNEVERDLYMLSAVGGKIYSNELEIWTDDKDIKFAELFFHDHNLDKYKVIAIIPRASDEARIWPWENFGKLINKLAQNNEDTYFLLMGGGESVETSAKIIDYVNTDRIFDLSNKTNLREAAELLRRCFLYVGCNTGLLHIAAAVKTPTVQIMSNSENGSPLEYASLSRYRAWGNKSYYIRPQKALPGCGAACYMRTAHCIRQISVDEVSSLVDNILAGKA